MDIKKLIKRILSEETNKVTKELNYLLGNQKYIDESFNKLKDIFFSNPRNNREKILTFIEEFGNELNSFYNIIFMNAKYAEKIIGMINESSVVKKRRINESTSEIEFEKFITYWEHINILYYKIRQSYLDIKNTSPNDTNALKPKIEEYYNLIYNDNNSMFELIKATKEYLKETLTRPKTNKETKSSNEIDWQSKRIIKRYPSSTIIYLSPEKVLERVGEDMGAGFDIRQAGVRIGNRLEKAMEYLSNPNAEAFQPTALYVEYYTGEPKVGISDGRHRVLAAYNLGLKEFPFEVYSPNENEQNKNAKYLLSILK